MNRVQSSASAAPKPAITIVLTRATTAWRISFARAFVIKVGRPKALSSKTPSGVSPSVEQVVVVVTVVVVVSVTVVVLDDVVDVVVV